MNSLVTFIKSRVIWERVHDIQLVIESYQIKASLTAPTLKFLGIEAHELYLIVDKPTTDAITTRDINGAGFQMSSRVADVILNDTLCWRDIHGEFQSFSVGNAWEAVRPRGAEVT
ncbi:hypothetical protein Tco_0137644 [Tanacetum coccineum]